jgi:hypothetical protein
VLTLCAALVLAASGPAVAGDPPVPPASSGFDVAAPAPADGPNLVLNGDFENTTAAGCVWNMPNADFTAAMANATAFGDADEMDIMNDPAGCGYLGPPHSGDVKIAITAVELNGPVDAFSIELSAPVEQGENYTLTFYAWQFGRDFAPDTGPVLVGLSNGATDFGTQIYSATPDTSGWTEMTHTFDAPIDATYLTCKADATGDTWTHLDNFSLCSTSSPVSESSWSMVKGLYR